MKKFGLLVAFSMILVACALLNRSPEEPTPVYPPNGATDVPLDVVLEWNATDPDGDDLSYNVFFGTDPSPTLVASGLKSTSYDPGDLDYAVTYHWKVEVDDGRGGIVSGPIWSFKTLGCELVRDDFEDYEVDSDPSVIGWGEYDRVEPSYAVIVDDGNPGKALKFVDNDIEGYARLKKDFPEFKKGILEFDMKVNDDKGWFEVRLTGKTSQSIFGPIVGIGWLYGELSVFAFHEDVYNSYQSVMEAQTGRWYRIRIEFDLEKSGEYDVYVDGELKGQGTTRQTKITELIIWTLPTYRCSEGYIDNVKLIVLDEGYSEH